MAHRWGEGAGTCAVTLSRLETRSPRDPGCGSSDALTEVGISLSVIAHHVGAAATVALADAALVQRVRGEEHPVTADGLQRERRGGCWECSKARAPGAATATGRQVAGRRNETSGTCATMFNNLTFSRHANPSQVGELAGRAVAGGDHELPLAVHGGAVQVAWLAGDVDIVIWGRQRVSGLGAGFRDFPSPSY